MPWASRKAVVLAVMSIGYGGTTPTLCASMTCIAASTALAVVTVGTDVRRCMRSAISPCASGPERNDPDVHAYAMAAGPIAHNLSAASSAESFILTSDEVERWASGRTRRLKCTEWPGGTAA